MNKCSPEKLKDAADDLQSWVYRHQDVVRVEPEISKMVIEARDKAYKKLREVTEREPRKLPHSSSNR